MAWFGAPLQVAAVFVLGARAQRQACLGELETGGLLPGGHRRRRPARLWDRRPFVWIHPTVWATAIKEVKVVRRDPILVVMMVSQSVLLLLPPLLFLNISPRSGSVVGRAYLPLFLPLLLMAEHMPLFNQISLDGRGLRFLAQTPASRFQILVGKNLAYLCLFTGLNAAALGLAATLFSAWDQYLLYLGLSVAGLVVLMAVGNVVSVVLPVAWTGPRAAAGGARGAQAASEGGVERPGCLVTIARLFFLQVAVLLFLPVLYPILLLSVFAQPAALWAAALGALAYALLLYLLGTTVAARQLERNEDLLLERLAGRSAT